MSTKYLVATLLILLSIGGIGVFLFSGALEQAEQQSPESQASSYSSFPEENQLLAEEKTITIYKDPSCECCEGYAAYLEEQGFKVTIQVVSDVSTVKAEYGVPKELQSCHTATFGEYVVEGHVPVEALMKVAEQTHAGMGIALPGMPGGAPGMGGMQMSPFVVYSFTEEGVEEFMTL